MAFTELGNEVFVLVIVEIDDLFNRGLADDECLKTAEEILRITLTVDEGWFPTEFVVLVWFTFILFKVEYGVKLVVFNTEKGEGTKVLLAMWGEDTLETAAVNVEEYCFDEPRISFPLDELEWSVGFGRLVKLDVITLNIEELGIAFVVLLSTAWVAGDGNIEVEL